MTCYVEALERVRNSELRAKEPEIAEAVLDAFSLAWWYLEPWKGLAKGSGFVEGAHHNNWCRLALQVERLAVRTLKRNRRIADHEMEIRIVDEDWA